MSDFHRIRHFLGRTRRRARLIGSLEGALFLFLVAVGLCTSAALASWVASARQVEIIRLVLLSCLAVALIAVGVRFLLLPWFRLRKDVAVARFVDSRVPELRGAVLSAVELEPTLDSSPGTSSVLVRALLTQTAERLQRVEPRALVSQRELVRLGQAAALFAAVLVLGVLLAPDPFREGLRALFLSPNGAEPLLGRPGVLERDVAVHDIRFTLSFPAYTRRAPDIVENSGGDLTALVGTKVTVVTRSLEPATGGRIVLEGQDAAAVPLTLATDGTLRGELVVRNDTRYWFELTRRDGTTLVERARRSIEAEEDASPQVDLVYPREDFEVEPEDVVRFHFSASDDYGLDTVDLVTRKLETSDPPTWRRVTSPPGARSFVGDAEIDIKALDLHPGDVIAVTVEVKDNDTVSRDEKRATSRTVHLKLHSPEERHAAMMKSERELLDAMVNLLGARLESPIEDQKLERFDQLVDAQRLITERGAAMVSAFKALVLELKGDTLTAESTRADLEEILNRQRDLHESEAHHVKSALGEGRTSERSQHLAVLGKVNDQCVAQLEKDIILLEQIVDEEQEEVIVDHAKALLAAQKELTELLEKLKTTKDPATRLEIQRKLDRLMKHVDRLMADLRQRAKPAPYENVNAEALTPSSEMKGLTDMRSQLQKLHELVSEDKIEEAQKLADDIGKEVQSMLAELESDLDAATTAGAQRTQPELRRMMDALESTTHKQDAVHRETDGLERTMKKALSEKVRKELAPRIAEQLEHIRELEKALGKVSSDDVHKEDKKRLEELLRTARDLGETLSQEDLAQAARMAKTVAAELESLAREVEAMARSSAQHGEDAASHRMKRAASRLNGEVPRAHEIARELERMTPDPTELLEAHDQRRLEKLGQRQKQVNDGLSSLREKLDALEQESPGLGAKLDKMLEGAGKAMDDAHKRLSERQPGRAETHQRDALDKLNEAKKSVEQAMGKPRRDAGETVGLDRSDRKVEIPDGDRYSVPKELRDELLRAFKEQAPRRYKRLVERYYESLVE